MNDTTSKILYNGAFLLVGAYLGFRAFEISVFTEMTSKTQLATGIFLGLNLAVALIFKYLVFSEMKVYAWLNPIVLVFTTLAVTAFTLMAVNYNFVIHEDEFCVPVVEYEIQQNHKKEVSYMARVKSEGVYSDLSEMTFPIDEVLYEMQPDSLHLKVGTGLARLTVIRGISTACGS